MSQFTSLAQVEGAIEQATRALAGSEASGDAGQGEVGPADSGDGEALGQGMAAVLGAGVQLATELLAMAASTGGPEQKSSFVSASATDPLTGRKATKSNFLGASPATPVSRGQPRDIMAAPGKTGVGRGVDAGKAAKGMPKTPKGLDLDEAVTISGQSLNSPTRNLRANVNTSVSHASLRAQLDGLLGIAKDPTEQMAANDMDNPYLAASRFAMPEEAQNRIELTAGTAKPKPQPLPTPAPGMGSRG